MDRKRQTSLGSLYSPFASIHTRSPALVVESIFSTGKPTSPRQTRTKRKMSFTSSSTAVPGLQLVGFLGGPSSGWWRHQFRGNRAAHRPLKQTILSWESKSSNQKMSCQFMTKPATNGFVSIRSMICSGHWHCSKCGQPTTLVYNVGGTPKTEIHETFRAKPATCKKQLL